MNAPQRKPKGVISRLWDRVSGEESRQLRARSQRIAHRAAQAINHSVQAAQRSAANPGYTGVHSYRDEDAANKDYLTALGDVLQRSQDLDVNNPDLRGFNRTRTAQIVGSHVRFKSAPKAEEIGLDKKALLKLSGQIDRLRDLHSRTGGFDSTGKNRSEGIQQVRAVLTSFIHGACLIHRVWRPENPILPISIELIPGVRISTPYHRAGDPLISYGIEYADQHRTRVVAYHVRRVSKTIGDSFVPDYIWDRLPAEDCSLLEMIEPAGMDRAMPNSVACVRMFRNRGEMIESMVSAARAQANYYGAIECQPGKDPFDAASDDADQQGFDSDGSPMNFTKVGEAQLMYLANGEKLNWNSAKLPDPDFKGFMDVTDERLSRGVGSSLSRFTRKVNNSWAGGRLEDQQDDPIIDQYRGSFVSAWQKVNCWFLEAAWLAGKVDMPGFSSATAVFWCEFRAEFPGKLHINPQDTMAAREKGYSLRTTTPQQACEEDGKDLRENLRLWAEAEHLRKEVEAEFGLDEGALSYLIGTKTLSTSAGDDIVPPAPVTEQGSGEAAPPPPKNLRIAGGAS